MGEELGKELGDTFWKIGGRFGGGTGPAAIWYPNLGGDSIPSFAQLSTALASEIFMATPADPFWLVAVLLSALPDVSTLRTAPACSRCQDNKYVHPRRDHEIMCDGLGWVGGGASSRGFGESSESNRATARVTGLGYQREKQTMLIFTLIRLCEMAQQTAAQFV